MTSDHNKHLVQRLVQIVNERDFDAIEEVASGQIASEARRWVGPFRDSFPDFQMEVIDVIAEDDNAPIEHAFSVFPRISATSSRASTTCSRLTSRRRSSRRTRVGTSMTAGSMGASAAGLVC
jgi:hypothetical protein